MNECKSKKGKVCIQNVEGVNIWTHNHVYVKTVLFGVSGRRSFQFSCRMFVQQKKS